MKVLIGTTNPSKVNRFYDLLSDCPVDLITLKDLNILDEPEECGNTPAENAEIKALFYGSYFDYVICNDSGLYFDCLPHEDARQPGLHIRTPNGIRLNDDEMIAYYKTLIASLGGKILSYYINGFAVYRKGELFQFIEQEEAYQLHAFYMVSDAHPFRHEGWPLDSLSIDKDTGSYFVETENPQYLKEEGAIKAFQHRNHLIQFLTSSLGIKRR